MFVILHSKPARQHMSRIGLAWLGVVLLQFVVVFAVYFTFGACSKEGLQFHGFLPSQLMETLRETQASLSSSEYAYTLTLLLTTIIADLVPFIICAKYVGIINTEDIFSPSRIGVPETALFAVVGFGASYLASMLVKIIQLILKMAGIKTVSGQINIPWNEAPAAIIMIITVVLIAPLAEEYLCRGVILNVFKRFGNVFAVVGSSLIWALLHGNIVQGIPVFVLGIFFGIIAVRAKSILPSFILHVLNNLIAVLQLAAINFGAKPIVAIFGAFIFMVIAAGIAFFCIFRKKFIVEKSEGDSYGFKTFFTSPSILIGIAVCLALTARTFSAI